MHLRENAVKSKVEMKPMPFRKDEQVIFVFLYNTLIIQVARLTKGKRSINVGTMCP